MSIPFSLVEETARDIIGHDCDPVDNIPRRNYIARQYLWPHQLSVKQTAVFAPVVFSRALFVANFIHRDAGLSNGFPFKAGGVHLVVVPVDYSENIRVLVDELRDRMPAVASA